MKKDLIIRLSMEISAMAHTKWSIMNKNGNIISPKWLLAIKNILAYCGNGRFPLIENSIMSSYLSTIIYLDEIDCELFSYLQYKVPQLNAFNIVRYVDDMYILFSSDLSLDDFRLVYTDIINTYSSFLKNMDFR